MREVDNLEVEDVKNVTKGKVANCKLLNVRKKPSLKSDSIRIIKEGDEVELLNHSPNRNFDFYKVLLKDGSVGFCMSEFINVE